MIALSPTVSGHAANVVEEATTTINAVASAENTSCNLCPIERSIRSYTIPSSFGTIYLYGRSLRLRQSGHRGHVPHRRAGDRRAGQRGQPCGRTHLPAARADF